jgi:hypothetical protein
MRTTEPRSCHACAVLRGDAAAQGVLEGEGGGRWGARRGARRPLCSGLGTCTAQYTVQHTAHSQHSTQHTAHSTAQHVWSPCVAGQPYTPSAESDLCVCVRERRTAGRRCTLRHTKRAWATSAATIVRRACVSCWRREPTAVPETRCASPWVRRCAVRAVPCCACCACALVKLRHAAAVLPSRSRVGSRWTTHGATLLFVGCSKPLKW